MKDKQLESCLKTLKSSTRNPDAIDETLEKRLIGEMRQREISFGARRSTFKLAIIATSCVIVMLVGVVVADNIDVSTTKTDAAGNVVVHNESLWKYIKAHIHEHVRGFHEHLRDHFH